MDLAETESVLVADVQRLLGGGGFAAAEAGGPGCSAARASACTCCASSTARAGSRKSGSPSVASSWAVAVLRLGSLRPTSETVDLARAVPLSKLFVPVATVESNFDLRQPLRAWVSLVTGETVTSNGRRLLARDFAPGRVAEHLHRGRTS